MYIKYTVLKCYKNRNFHFNGYDNNVERYDLDVWI